MKTINRSLPELAILLCALALRLFIVSQVDWQPLSDSRDYQTLAKNLIDGEGYIQIYQGESPEYQGLTFRAYRMPGYPLILAGLFKILGYHPILGLYLNIVLDLVTCVFILSFSTLIGRLSASIAALIFASHVLWVPLLMSESLVTCCMTGLIAVLARKLWQQSNLASAASGALLAAAVMTKPVAIVLIPFFLWQQFFSEGRGTIGKLVLIIIPVTIAVSFWGYRNYSIFQRPVLFSTNFGAHNAPDFGIDKRQLVQELRAEGLDEAAINDHIRREILKKVMGQPDWALKIYTRRIINMFSTESVSEITAIVLPKLFAHASTASLYYSLSLSQYLVVYLLGALGLLCFAFARRDLRFLTAFFISFLLLHCLVSNGNIRFMAPIYPIMCIACAWLLSTAYCKMRAGTKA